MELIYTDARLEDAASSAGQGRLQRGRRAQLVAHRGPRGGAGARLRGLRRRTEFGGVVSSTETDTATGAMTLITWLGI